MGDVTRVAKEGFEAPRLIKVYNAQGHLAQQFDAVNERNRRSNMRLILTKGLSNPIVQLLTAIGLAVVLSIAIADAVHGRMRWATCSPSSPLWSASRSRCASWWASRGRCSRASPAARACSSCSMSRWSRRAASLRAARVRGAVRFEHVSFAYRADDSPGEGAPAGVARRAPCRGTRRHIAGDSRRGELWPSSGARAAASPRW